MEDEEDLFVEELPLSASEDEEEESDSERKHQKLLEAISSLDGKKRRRLAERTEASLQVSEFGISSEGAGEKISLTDLIQPIKQTASLSSVKKQLNKLKDTKSVELPLSNEETQKIQRVISYTKASEEVAKWAEVVKQNRTAEKLIFPLTDETLKPARIEEKVSGWKARTPLEMEIFSILNNNKQPITDPLLTPVEEASLKAMSLEEAKLRRAELQKARALQSYYEAKARREKKIKSKKYHKVLKKGKQKEAIKAFEELRKTNPDAALEELEKLERARMEERMTLKHQNSGKWAKSKAIMAKYDDEARKAMQEQLQRNKDLTRKIEVRSESEESAGEGEETVPDFVNDAPVISEGPNPWMTGKLSSDAKDSGSREEGEEESESITKPEDQDDAEEEEEESEEEALLREFEDKRRWRKQEEEESNDKEQSNPLEGEQEAEEKRVSQFNRLFQKLMEQNRKEEEKSERGAAVLPAEPQEAESEEELQGAEEEEDEAPLLVESVERRRTLEDVDDLAQEEKIDELKTQPKERKTQKSGEQPSVQPTNHKPARKSELIDHNDVLPARAQKVRTPLLPITMEEEEEEEVEDDETAQKMIIQEAFAGDDVINDFLKEKRKAEAAGKPKNINLVLPGWGEWGGTNLKVSSKKRRKFIIKAPPAPPRKDQRLPNVIINEKRNINAAAHQVNELPYPFNSRKHFESSIRTPLGKTWNTEKAVQKLTSPRVITKRGHIIEPITDEAFEKHAKTSRTTDLELNTPKQKPERKHFQKRKPKTSNK